MKGAKRNAKFHYRMERPYEWTLQNGLRIIYAHHENKASFTVAIAAKAGVFYEPLEAPRGLAHFTEHMCFDGTKNYPDKEKLIEIIDNVGGDWNGSTGHQGVQYYAHVLGEDAEKAFEFVSEIYCNPLLNEKDLIHEKKIIKEEIHAAESDPWDAVYSSIRTS
ncbi:MAG: insulinase family protein, partial [Chloroflexota bacterium]|nr:insulinase family protein [Chloroflexota bacterium]